MSVLAHDEVREQGDALAGRRQVVERAHRHLDLVADPARFDQDLRRIFLEKRTREPADHTRRPLFTRKPRVASFPSPCPPCAWQMAHASASAESAEGAPASPRSRFTISCTCTFFAWPLPTTACLTWRAVYSETGKPASTAAQIAVPRAWPSASVDAGLMLTKTFSSAICCGRCRAMTSRRFSRMIFRRSGRSASPDLMQPLAM